MFPNPQARPASRPAHPERDAIVNTSQPSQSAQLAVPPAPARQGNGLGVAALVLGVASLVAAVSFTLFPLGLIGGLAAPLVLARPALGPSQEPCAASWPWPSASRSPCTSAYS